jgi:hypothetical protein
MGHTSVPEALVIHQRWTPGYNPETFKQHYDHGGSLQLHTKQLLCLTGFTVIFIPGVFKLCVATLEPIDISFRVSRQN